MRAGFGLYYCLLSNKIIQQDRIEVQEICSSDLGKNELNKHKVSADGNQFCSINFKVMTFIIPHGRPVA